MGQAGGRDKSGPYDAFHGFYYQMVLYVFDALMQGLFCIAFFNSDLGATDDGAGVYLWSDVMHGAAGDFDACFKGMFDDVQASKGRDDCSVAGGIGAAATVVGQECGMQVKNASGEVVDEFGTENAHPASQNDEVDLEEGKQGRQFCFGLCPLTPWEVDGREFVL